MSYVHPFLRRNNWRNRNLCLAGNFNITNEKELFASMVQGQGQHPRSDADTFLILEQMGALLDENHSDLYRKFKKEGLVYYVSIDDRDTDPMYVRLFRYHSYNTSRTHAKIVAHAADFCIKKMAKVVTFDDSYYVQSELYLTSAEAFKNIFYKMLSQVDAVEEAISEVCD